MSQLPALALTPEAEELQRKRSELAQIEVALSEGELELTTLRAELAAFERRYLELVGRRYAELDRLEAQIAELLARRDPGDDAAQSAAREARARAHASAEAAGTPDHEPAERDFRPSESLKRLYKQAAVLMHPDLATDPAAKARRHRFMSELNNAYSDGDEDRIRELLREWHSHPENVEGDGIAADLVRVIRQIAQIRNRLAAIAREQQETRDSDLFRLKARVDEATRDDRDLLQEMAERVQAEIEAARMRLGRLAEK
ncbi:MAG: hypothetical protein WED34_01130 [Planctomycetales bacterium]